MLEIKIHKHPSGGFIVNLPEDTPFRVLDIINNLAVWKNSSSIPETTEYEFSSAIFNRDIDVFHHWFEKVIQCICTMDVIIEQI